MANWYVRPSGTTYGNADGTTYADAWSGFGNIVWDGAGIQGNDTLYVCGTYGGGAGNRLEVGMSGNSNAERLTIRGDYPGDPGIFDGSDSSGIRFGYAVDDYRYIPPRDNINFIGLTFIDPSDQGGAANQGLQSTGGSQNIAIDDCHFEDLRTKGIFILG